MSKLLRTLLVSLMACTSLSSVAVVKETQNVELQINMKPKSYINVMNIPTQIEFVVNPFKGRNDSKYIYVNADWSVQSDLTITGQVTCDAANKQICELMIAVIRFPAPSSHLACILIDRTEKPDSYTFTQEAWRNIKDPAWVWEFSAHGSYYEPLEARTYKALFTLTIEAAV
ncbi:hypothetical protein [Photobacterium profundum]|uniref:Orphan protein n=1 Tax=Photobacterium profundum (strain SS9) TaxID=298386 RepID=Q6LFW3_PHOPR|nr:hypothetical protein [Photobacterium profundum]CAG23817.1 hypothetical protein PBPRB1972 [Photobacterium profundum SS9]